MHDPLIHARAFVLASKLSGYIIGQGDAQTIMFHLHESARSFFEAWRQQPDVSRWMLGFLHNMATNYYRSSQIDEAETLLLQIVQEKSDLYRPWHPKAYLLLSLVCTEAHDFIRAAQYLTLAEAHRTEHEMAWLLFAKGKLQQEIAGNQGDQAGLKAAATQLHLAYLEAEKRQDPFLMADILDTLAFVYQDLRDTVSFQVISALCRRLNERCNVPREGIKMLAPALTRLYAKEAEEDAQALFDPDWSGHYQYADF